MSSTLDTQSWSAVSPDDDSADLHTALAALHGKAPRPGSGPRSPRSSRRALLGVALCGLLIGGMLALATADPESRPAADDSNPSDDVYLSAHPGSCLVWQPGAQDRPSFVQCTTPHMFEVAKDIDADDSQQSCDLLVRQYLGERYDPDSKFGIAELSPADRSAGGQRKMLCGLQLAGPDGHPVPFRGQVAGADQSKVWPPGTCLGLDPKTSKPTDSVVDCAAPHAVEVIGAVNLGDRFHDLGATTPPEAEQTEELRDSCGRLADAYLAPRTVASTGLTVIYHAITPTSWNAGSRHTLCSLGAKQPGPVIGLAKSHHPPVTDESTSAPTESAPAAEPTHERPAQTAPETAVTHMPQQTVTAPAPTASVAAPTPDATTNTPGPVPQAPAGTQTINQVPAGPAAPAHEVIQIPGLAPVTVPAMPEQPGSAPVLLTP